MTFNFACVLRTVIPTGEKKSLELAVPSLGDRRNFSTNLYCHESLGLVDKEIYKGA